MIYAGIDPGVVSGVAAYFTQTGHFESEELPTLGAVADWVRSWDNSSPIIITEKFVISGRTIKTAVQYESLYMNGWLSIEYPQSMEQTAAQAKAFATNDKLKALGWYNPTKDGHANDAARHILYRAARNRDERVVKALKEML